MLFLVGLVFGSVTGIVMLLIFGTPLMLGKGFGLLWGDRRLWWTLAVLIACLVGFARFADEREKARQDTDFLSRGFGLCLNGSVIASTVGLGGLGFYRLMSWGGDWRAPIVGLSWILSLIALGILGWQAVKALQKCHIL